MQEGIIPTTEVTGLTVGIFIGLLFHDIGITLLDGYLLHEAGSIILATSLLIDLETKGKISEEQKNDIWAGVFSIYGTKLYIASNNKLESMSSQTKHEFVQVMLADLEKFGSQSNNTQKRPIFKAAVVQSKAKDFILNTENYEVIKQLSILYCAADLLGLLSQNSLEGTERVATEVDYLNKRNQEGKLPVKDFIGRVQFLIDTFLGAVNRLSHFPKDLISDNAIVPWITTAITLAKLTEPTEMNNETVLPEFLSKFDDIKKEFLLLCEQATTEQKTEEQ